MVSIDIMVSYYVFLSLFKGLIRLKSFIYNINRVKIFIVK